ncbi:MAG: cache domain-containing protein, partial [Cyanobacteriota bacterium]|nr:cache domain-containing protein [Cyanobacteriota bacterium]
MSVTLMKRFLCMFLSLTALVGAGLAGFYEVRKNAARKAIAIAENQSIRIRAANFTDSFSDIRADLMILATQNEVQNVLNPANSPQAMQENQRNLAEQFLVMSRQKRIFDQIRVLDATGQERIRTNFNQGKPRIVPERDLQNQAQRYWFQETLALQRGEVFISPLDLNVERGKIEQPFKPTIRFATPVFVDGQKRGTIVLNYLAEYLLQELEQNRSTTSGDAFLLNADGYWLKGMKPEEEWGFMFGDRQNRTFASTFPNAWPQISTRETGQFQTSEGLFTFTTIYPLLDIWGAQSLEEATQLAGLSMGIAEPKSYRWKLVSFVPTAVLEQQARAILPVLLIFYVGLSGIFGVGCWFLATLWMNRQRATADLQQS